MHLLPLGLLVLLAVACGDASAPAPAPRPPRAAGSRQDAWVEVRPPSDRALLEAPATALPGADALVAVSASYALRVVRVHVRPGDEVAADAAIVDVASAPVLEAAARYVSASESITAHEQRLATLRPLREERVVPTERVFEVEEHVLEQRAVQREALAVLRAAGVSPGAARSVLARGTITLRTPAAGVVRDVPAIAGQFLPEGGTFATLVGGTSPRVEARFVEPLPEGFRFEFEGLDGRAVPLGDAPMRVLDSGEEGGVRAWFDVPEGASLPAGAPGHVHAIATDARYVEVPLEALAPDGATARVRRRRGETEATIPVRVLATSGATALVVGDLVVGDRVAADGARATERDRHEGEP